MQSKEKQSSLNNFSWTNYNLSQTKEKILFLQLLKELCNTLKQPENERVLLNADVSHKIFCMCVKIYAMKSSRRLTGELELCRRSGYLHSLVPHWNSVLNYFGNPNLTSILHDLIKVSSLPLRVIERKFCVDSTGFGMKVLEDRWSFARDKYSKHHLYKKAHICYGVLSNIVTACKITDGKVADCPILPELIDATAQSFRLYEVSADKAYSSRKNIKAIWNHKALPFIPFKKGTKPNPKGSTQVWRQMYWWFERNNEEFMKRYHLRSNAESGMMMIKTRFGDTVMTRSETAIENELLCKILCHNICVLIQEMFLMDVEVDFLKLHNLKT